LVIHLSNSTAFYLKAVFWFLAHTWRDSPLRDSPNLSLNAKTGKHHFDPVAHTCPAIHLASRPSIQPVRQPFIKKFLQAFSGWPGMIAQGLECEHSFTLNRFVFVPQAVNQEWQSLDSVFSKLPQRLHSAFSHELIGVR
jgi:hypothetical protein